MDVPNPESVCTVGSPIPFINSGKTSKFEISLDALAAVFLAFDCLNLNILLPYSPPETRVSLLHGHNIQLQHGGPHQLLLTVEMRPTQGLVRQVPQALHEGSIAFIQTWDVSTGKPTQERDDEKSTSALTLHVCIVLMYITVLHDVQTL